MVALNLLLVRNLLLVKVSNLTHATTDLEALCGLAIRLDANCHGKIAFHHTCCTFI